MCTFETHLTPMKCGRLGICTTIPPALDINARALQRMIVTSAGETRPGALPRGRILEVESIDNQITTIVEPITSGISLESFAAACLFHEETIDVSYLYKILFQVMLFLEHYKFGGWLQRYPLTIVFLPTSLYFENNGSLAFSLCDSIYFSLNPSLFTKLPAADPFVLQKDHRPARTSFSSALYNIGSLMLELYSVNTQIHRRHRREAYSLASLSLVTLLTRFIAPSPLNRITSHEFNTSPYVLQAFETLHKEYRILDAVGSTPLIAAAAVNDLPMVQRNLAQRKQKNFLGYTALATAVIHHHIEPLYLLASIEGGEQMACGETALIIACKEGFLEAIPILAPFEAGQSDYFGETALMIAAANNWVFAVQLLIAKECSLITRAHHRCGSGFTALMAAGQANAKAAFELLLPEEYHLSQPPSSQFPHGKTVRQWCEEFQATDCLLCLEKYEERN
ncbi:Protein 21.1 [Giardia lamblia P15]|uniref:Protein 21.1 n=1 Tax=Giardia intestinalis (strain P15) TaxID=658858 RepID=E1F907_GIAIA|nr:Protein 21.1 [Giardia lamblia P15]